ncbi:AMP-binding protein [Paenarthrobacter sp. NPDC057355]|uniref:AMP-binding protein n=1 Tax=Paenarthrobacter sp. NPDC057355 TaxID=3346105 RepID=UPI003645EB65
MSIQPDLAGVAFAARLASFGERPAVRLPGQTVTYAQLAARVEEMARSFGDGRRLIALEAENTLPSLTVYLAALASGQPLLILPSGGGQAAESLVAAYDPDIVARSVDGDIRLDIRREHSGHELHPELALLLSTSGSTGAPKLVRISAESIQANAAAIAQYLHLRKDDRAATTLPLSYCYGMSVVNSHLLVGASIALTDLSVVDPCFWDLMRRESMTSFAAVPYTFDLLERVGFEGMDLPSLRYITQAGGRLTPDRVRAYAQLGQERGWDLFVMYGQTEATARMAYLPPDKAAEHPHAIGVPVSGGSFRLEPVPGLDDSELVYSGPNVMLGYAEHPADLARGRDVTELRTGDLARLGPGGLYEIVGRRSRFVKIVGLRIDLGQVERMLADYGLTAAVAGSDDGLAAVVEGSHELSLIAKAAAQDLGIPRAALKLFSVQAIPRLANGKTDYQAILALAQADADAPPGSTTPPGEKHDGGPGPSAAESPDDARRIFIDVLEREDVADTDTFVSLGGDSLSYVAASVRLERALGYLPHGWHLMPVCELTPAVEREVTGAARTNGARPNVGSAGQKASTGPGRKRRPKKLTARMETGIVLRAVAIVFIVSTHVGLFDWEGTAHVLLAVAGYNFARFQLAGSRQQRLRRQLKAVARIALPSIVVISAAFAMTDDYGWHNIFLLNTLVGPQGWTDMSRFWFIEILVHILLGVAALLAIPALDRAQRRWPWLLPLVLGGVDLLQRFDIIELPYPGQGPVLWLFALGWVAALSRKWWQRAAATAAAFLTIPGFFTNELRSTTVLVGFLVLLWVATLPVPRGLHRLTAMLASSSLYIYVTHWLVYPLIVEADSGLAPELALGLAVVASLAAGVGYWVLATRAMGAAERWLGRRRQLPRRSQRQPT